MHFWIQFLCRNKLINVRRMRFFRLDLLINYDFFLVDRLFFFLVDVSCRIFRDGDSSFISLIAMLRNESGRRL